MSSVARSDPPYLRIVAEIDARIRSGDFSPGQRLLSIRQIAKRWDVAVATATKVVAVLREKGLVETKVGSGTVVSALSAQRLPANRTATSVTRPSTGVVRHTLSREHLLRVAIAIADAEGVDAVSMRRIAAEMSVGPMSLYRHVATKDELVVQMADKVFGESELPATGPEEWRAKLELIARRQWALCRRHLWLPKVISFTRPSFAPNMMAHTEWTLRALDGLGLTITTRMQEALTLHSLVLTAALSMSREVETEQETGVTLARWVRAQRTRTDELFIGGRFPLLAEVHENTVPDIDGLFEYNLARHLDGFALLVQAAQRQDPHSVQAER